MKKRPKKKWIFYTVLFVFSCIAVLSIYAVTQYNQGLSEAAEGKFQDDGTTYDAFRGEEPEFGEINILMIGSDTRGEERGLSDTIMIAQYDQDSSEIKLVSLMRDTYVEVPGYGMQKINAAFSYGGPELLRQTIKHNFDIDLYYYAVVDFEGFSKIADLIAPEGIEVNIPHQMSEGIGMTLGPGREVLDGEKMLGYVRFRKDENNDYGRVERQQEVIAKLTKEAVNIQNFVKLPKLLGMADPYIDTNIDSKTLLSMGKGIVSDKDQSIETLRIPVDYSYENAYTGAGAVLDIDAEENKQQLQNFLSGQIQ